MKNYQREPAPKFKPPVRDKPSCKNKPSLQTSPGTNRPRNKPSPWTHGPQNKSSPMFWSPDQETFINKMFELKSYLEASCQTCTPAHGDRPQINEDNTPININMKRPSWARAHFT